MRKLSNTSEERMLKALKALAYIILTVIVPLFVFVLGHMIILHFA